MTVYGGRWMWETVGLRTPHDDALFPLLLCFREALLGEDTQLLDERVLPVDEQVRVVTPYCPLYEFLQPRRQYLAPAHNLGQQTDIPSS